MFRTRLVEGVCSLRVLQGVFAVVCSVLWAPSRLPKNLSSSFVAKNGEQHVNRLGSHK